MTGKKIKFEINGHKLKRKILKLQDKIKTNKTYKTAFLFFLAFMLLAVFSFISNISKNHTTTKSISRPEPGQVAGNKELEAYDEDGNLITNLNLNLEARKLNDEEIEDYFQKAYEEASSKILGDNESLDKVKSDLNFIESACNNTIRISWFSDNYKIVNYSGKVFNENIIDEEVNVSIKANMSYEDKGKTYTFDIKVIPADDVNSFENQLKRQVDDSINSSANDEKIDLPTKVDNKNISYKEEKEEGSVLVFVILAVVGSVMVVLSEKEKLKEKKKARIKEMKFDYSEVVSKLSLLISSGMTIRLAWKKITSDYVRNLKLGKTKRHAIYDEMYITECNMESGISEAVCYEHFASRINIKEYSKLASLLESSLKKGSKDLILLLENETREAFNLRKHMALKKGEETSTKLLIPMIIMLVIVMIIVLFPALTSFGV